MNNSDLISDIEKFIDYSRYYFYNNNKRYEKSVNLLLKMRNHIENDDIDKCMRKEDKMRDEE